jgi:hypothetical protein
MGYTLIKSYSNICNLKMGNRFNADFNKIYLLSPKNVIFVVVRLSCLMFLNLTYFIYFCNYKPLLGYKIKPRKFLLNT